VNTIQPTDTLSQVFGPLVVHYDERVLTPRPWTLMQSLWATEIASRTEPGSMLELCAGAGQIGLAVAALTGRLLVQVEADPVAAGYAHSNAVLAGCDSRVEVRNARMQIALAGGERFPIILADPPYLPTADIQRWPEDPVTAIDGGADGLDLTRVCLQVGSRHLTPGGSMLLQVAGEAQARAVAAMLGTTGEYDLTYLETRHHDRDRAVMLLTRAARSTS
jgi:release factor glutamine methyltransferase